MRRLALLAAVLLTVACGSENEPTEALPAPATIEAAPAPSPPETAPADTTRVSVYFLRDGRIAAARRDVQPTRAVARAALEALAAGTSPAERRTGMSTSVPRKLEIEQLTVEDGAARIDFVGKQCPPTAQIVFTLTQFPTVRRVTGDCIPRSAYGKGLTRADLEELTPAILVESPTVGEDARSPLRITGSSNTFEATFIVNVVDGEGRVVAEQVVTATSGSGDRGTFDVSVPFDVDAPGAGALLAFERSAEDGSQLHLVEIPLRLVP
jgi:hypothetical protein